MEEVDQQQTENPVEVEVDDTGTHDEDLRVSASDRLLEVYDQIVSTEDVAQKTAAFLTTSNFYNFAIRISNSINSRQGKNRITIDYDTYELMKYSVESDIDEITDQRLTELFVDILNVYLDDKQELPTNDKEASGVSSRVRALIVMLISTNQYGVLPHLNLPRYVVNDVARFFTEMNEQKLSASMQLADAYIEMGNPEMAEIVRSKGLDFWGPEGTKPSVNFDKNFSMIKDKIKEPAEAYSLYLTYRNDYLKSTKTILPSYVSKTMKLTPGQYNRARRNVYTEITQLFPENENVKIVKRLLYEN